MRVRVDSGVDEAALRGVLACGVTDMRGGFHSLAARVQTVLQHDPYRGAIFIFRGLFMTGKGCACMPRSWIAATSAFSHAFPTALPKKRDKVG